MIIYSNHKQYKQWRLNDGALEYFNENDDHEWNPSTLPEHLKGKYIEILFDSYFDQLLAEL